MISISKKKKPKGKVKGAIKHQAINSMGAVNVERMEMLLVKGFSCPKVAQVITGEWGFFKDVDIKTVGKQVLRYKNDVLDYKLHAKHMINGEHKKGKGLNIDGGGLLVYSNPSKIDAFDTIQEMIKVQNERVQKLYAVENKLPTLMNQLRAELKELRDMLKQYSELQFDMGLIVRQPKTFIGALTMTELEQRELLRGSKKLSDETTNATHDVFAMLESMAVEDGEFTEVLQ